MIRYFPLVPLQTQHRFSVKEYYRMAETGVLRPEARVELLDGQIIDMSPIGPFHGGVTKRLNRFFTNLGKGQWLVAVRSEVRRVGNACRYRWSGLPYTSSDSIGRRHGET